MTLSWAGALVSLGCAGLYVWQDGIHQCNDGARYTSKQPQPAPFCRRKCNWDPMHLILANAAALALLGASVGGVTGSLVLATLPGVWFCVTRPTTVDLVSMGLAWACHLLWSVGHYPAAICCSYLSGRVHERGPVFAAVYTWSPWPLLGLLGPSWLAKPGKDTQNDELSGLSTFQALLAHRKHQDLLSFQAILFPLRGIWAAAVLNGLGVRECVALVLAYGTRVLGTDVARFALWGAPAVVESFHGNIPAWLVFLHVFSFTRLA